MTLEELLQEYPTRRIKPVDGMPVTAETWDEAHEYHRQQQRFHALMGHGPGIVMGLGVIASDPPDSAVYILPGIAIDPLGRIIVLQKAVSFDLGPAQGALHVLLTYDESRPAAGGSDEPMFVQSGFGVEAGLLSADTPSVELARIRRSSRDAPLLDAKTPAQAGPNEIDLRFRTLAGPLPHVTERMAVSYLGGADGTHERGAANLARLVRRVGEYRLWVDAGVPIDGNISTYALLYLVGLGTFQLNRDEMGALYSYMRGGGTILFESCRRAGSGEPPSDACFFDLLASFGIQLAEIPRGHALWSEPYVFGAAPQGYEGDATPKVLMAEGVVFSGADYGCLWQGERRGGAASREQIRAALEWGANVANFAVQRHLTKR